jgi:chromosomal replication initiation ATPase DnaA
VNAEQLTKLIGEFRESYSRMLLAAQNLAAELSRAEDASRSDIDIVIDTVCSTFGLHRNVVLGKGRTMEETDARFAGIWIARTLLGLGYQRLSEEFGLDHHSGAMYAVREMPNRIASRPAYATKVHQALHTVSTRLAELRAA